MKKGIWLAVVGFLTLASISLAHPHNQIFFEFLHTGGNTYRSVVDRPLKTAGDKSIRLVYPDACRCAAPRVSETEFSVLEESQCVCTPADFAGEKIGILGLSQTLTGNLTVRLPHGRSFVRLLSEENSRFRVPPPLTFGVVGQRGLMSGCHWLCTHPVFLVVVMGLSFLLYGGRRDPGGAGLLLPGLVLTGFMAGAVLGAFRCLDAVPALGEVLLMMPCVVLFLNRMSCERRELPAGVLSLVLGPGALLAGAPIFASCGQEGLSLRQTVLCLAVFFAPAVLSSLALWGMIRVDAGQQRRQEKARNSGLGRMIFAASALLLAYYLWAFAGSWKGLFLQHTHLVLAAAAGFCLSCAAAGRMSWPMLAAFPLAYVCGTGAEGLSVNVPEPGLFLAVAVSGVALAVLKHREMSPPVSCAAVLITGFCLGALDGIWMKQDISLTPQGVLTAVVTVFSFFICGSWLNGYVPRRFAAPLNMSVAVGAMGLAAWLRFGEISRWVWEVFLPDQDLGLITLPVISLAALGMFLIIAPRRSSLDRILGRQPGRRLSPDLLILTAFFAVNCATVRIHDPFIRNLTVSADKTGPALTGILRNIYQSFYLKDDERVYNILSRQMEGELFRRVFLASRRGLEEVNRSAMDVRVQSVDVTDLKPLSSDTAAQTYMFDARWLVKAKIRHWRHTHLRLNSYQGVLTVHFTGEHWKLTGMDIHDEQQSIGAWKK